MIPALALNMTDPLPLMLGIIVTTVVGCGAGFVLGTSVGKTDGTSTLPSTIQQTRDRLSSARERLEKASTELNNAQRSDLAGSALVLARRISEVSTQLGRTQRKARQEGSA